MQFGNLALTRCKYGWMLHCGPFIGKCFELYGQYSESEVAMMRQFLRAGDTVIDIGANHGDLTLPLSRIVGESGRVYAVESHPDVFNVLCANLALNGIRNTMPVNAFIAATEHPDTSGPWGPTAYVAEPWRTHFLALDALELQACHLMKIDVDGNEVEVLKSGEMQIERFRPVLYFENDVHEKSEQLLSFAMHTLGYDLYWHAAPIFDEDNFLGNRVNHWAPDEIVSLMIVGVPAERRSPVANLVRIANASEWWPGMTT